jgi:hypothetical protein
VDFEQERKRRKADRRREFAAEARKRERRDQRVPKRRRLLTRPSATMMSAPAIEAERAAVEKWAQGEEARWEKEKEKLAAFEPGAKRVAVNVCAAGVRDIGTECVLIALACGSFRIGERK